MGKRSTRITPKLGRRVKRVTRSPEGVNEDREERFSTEENRTNKRQTTTRRAGRTATKRKAEPTEKETPSSRYSSSSSVGNESQEESVQIPKKKRYEKEESKPSRAKNKKSTANIPSDALTKTDKGKAGRAGETRTVKKRSRNQRQTFERIRDLIVTKKVYSKWKPLGPSTKDYIKQVIADTVPKVMSNFSSEKSKEEVQHCLSHLEKRINVKMNQIKGPSQQTDYRDIEQNSKSIEESLASVNSQLSMIEDELQEQRRFLEEEEEKLKTLKSRPTKEPNTKTQPLHPILKKTFTSSLNLPTLSKEALNLPIPQILPEVNKGAERLSKTLSELSNTMDNVGLTQWLESVSQLQSLLNLTNHDNINGN